MKSLMKDLILASSLFYAGCNSGGDNSTKNQLPNRAPIIRQIPLQEVNEGSSFTMSLEQYVTDPDGDPVTIYKNGAGIGSIEGNRFIYSDSRDNDRLNNQYQVQILASDEKGGTAASSFLVVQKDNFYRISPDFFSAKNWVAYSPTNFDPTRNQYPSESSIREDLGKLASINTHGIVTYGSAGNLWQIPRIAKEAGIQKVVQGIWDPFDANELSNALQANPFVDGFCAGNEGLLNNRYDLSRLESAIDFIRYQTDKPVATSEPIGNYNQRLLEVGDWVFPNAHPFWQGITDPTLAVQWTAQQHDSISARTPLKVVFKEIGLPSQGQNGLSQENQNRYYRELEDLLIQNPSSDTKFVKFEAYDQPWKNNLPVEPHWGLFNSDRTPKIAATPQIIHTYVPRMNTFDDLVGRVVNVKPEDHMVTTYIHYSGGWWVKPTFANPLTSIAANGSWVTDITTGGFDQLATPINSYLVTLNYSPPSLPPTVNGRDVLHYVSSERPR